MSENSRVSIGASPIHGMGVIAARPFRKGETLFIIKGSLKRFAIKCKADSHTGKNWIGVGKNLWIAPVAPASFLNHSCAPNAGIRGRVTVTALRDIGAAEEITIDYSITEIDPFWSMRCRCCSVGCRKRIRSIQHLHPHMFIRYIPCVPTYFAMTYFRNYNG